MGGTVCCFCSNSRNKYRTLRPELESKLVETIRQRSISKESSFKSINAIIMRFPQFKEGLQNIRHVFKEFEMNKLVIFLPDEDSNETIDLEELIRCVEKLQLHLTDKEIKELYKSCDVDGDKGIQFNEFIVLLCLIYLLTTSTMESAEVIKTTFEAVVEAFLFLDSDKDGKVNKKDVVRALNEGHALERSPRHITRRRFKELDWHRSGKIGFKEFLFTFIDWVGINEDGDHNDELINIPIQD